MLNNGCNREFSTFQSPLILSWGRPRKSYGWKLLQALTSARCLLTIMSLSAPKYDKRDFSRLFSPDGKWGVMQEMYPQTYLIIAEENDDISWLDAKLIRSSGLYLKHLPGIFVLPHCFTIDRQEIFKVRFYCWYCGWELRGYKKNPEPLRVIETNCSTGKSSGGGKCLEDLIASSIFDGAAHLWSPSSRIYQRPSIQPHSDSLSREFNAQADMAAAAFLYGRNESMKVLPPHHFFPTLDITVRKLYKNVKVTGRQTFQYVGTTPAIKFITISGVFDMKSLYDVYLAPFAPQVWLTFVWMTGLSCLLEMMLLWTSARPPLSYALHEHLFWKFSAFIGQSEDMLPLSLSSTRKEPAVSALMIATTAWIIASTVIVYNYGAFFSTDTLRMFPYMTDYRNLMELENFTLYFPVNGKYCKNAPSNIKTRRNIHRNGKRMLLESICIQRV